MTDPFSFLPGGGVHRGGLAADNFTIVSNLVARDPKISYKAKGLFLNMSSHRQGFTITEELLLSQGKDGVSAIRSGLHELRRAGYIYRGTQQRHAPGTYNKAGKHIGGAVAGYRWHVTDKPEEIAAILKRLADEQAAERTDDDSAGGGGEQP